MRVESGAAEDDRYVRGVVTAVLGVLSGHGIPVDGGCVRALVGAVSHVLDESGVAEMRGGAAQPRRTAIVDAVWVTLRSRRLVTSAMRRAFVDAIDSCSASRGGRL